MGQILRVCKQLQSVVFAISPQEKMSRDVFSPVDVNFAKVHKLNCVQGFSAYCTLSKQLWRRMKTERSLARLDRREPWSNKPCPSRGVVSSTAICCWNCLAGSCSFAFGSNALPAINSGNVWFKMSDSENSWPVASTGRFWKQACVIFFTRSFPGTGIK